MNQIKKFVGNDMNQILNRIKSEMGSDAVILKSNTSRKFLSGVQEFEVIAGMDVQTVSKRTIPFTPIQNHSPKTRHNEFTSFLDSLKSQLPAKKSQSIYGDKDNAMKDEKTGLSQELKNLQILLQSIFPESDLSKPEPIQKIKCHLINNGAERLEVEKLIFQMQKLLGNKINQINAVQAQKIAKVLIEKKFKNKVPMESNPVKRIKIFIGPTGAGKTTTLAKLASRSVLEKKQNTILISLDSYRLGAHAQLKSYAEILNVPFYTASNPEDFRRTIKSIPSNTDIFIDTSGISPCNEMGIRKIASFINGIEDITVFLVLSAGYSRLQMENIFLKFKRVNYQKVILTKIDEISSYGHLLFISESSFESLDYLTDGQEVPEDIMSFSPSFLSEKILQVD